MSASTVVSRILKGPKVKTRNNSRQVTIGLPFSRAIEYQLLDLVYSEASRKIAERKPSINSESTTASYKLCESHEVLDAE